MLILRAIDLLETALLEASLAIPWNLIPCGADCANNRPEKAVIDIRSNVFIFYIFMNL